MSRAKLYRLVRDVHAVAGLALAATLALYAVTGFAIVHGDRLPNASHAERERVEIGFDARELATAGALRALAARAVDALRLEGRVATALERDGRVLVVRVERPASVATLRLDADSGEASLERRAHGLQQTLGNVHQLHGARGGVAHAIWAAWVDATGIALLAFAASGVALWAWTRADRLGLALLAGSTLSCVAAIATLWLAR
ncbi:MAG: PepSY-associated TM helix domain-containing protein [Myxococcota bacterium]